MNETYNADDPQQVGEAQKRFEKEKFSRDEVIRNIMSKRDGRSLMNSWLEFCDMFGSPHVPGDVYSTHINIGMSNIGKYIWSQLEEVTPESCILMRKEARENEKPKSSDAA